MGRPPKKPPAAWVRDPLSAPTWYERIWGAFTAKGWGVKEAAAKMGFDRYQTLIEWINGKSKTKTPPIEVLARVAEALDMSIDDIWFGRRGFKSDVRLAPELNLEQQKQLLTKINAQNEQREALDEYLEGPGGRRQRVTVTYLVEWVRAHAEARAKGLSKDQARSRAISAATRARAIEDAKALGLRGAEASTTGERAKVGP